MPKIKLYEPFEHWYHGGVIWLYSDPHFSDPESKLINPNWPDDEYQVKKINNGLGKNDTIIFLGDICNTEAVKKIKGYKVLLLGNHDKGASNYKKMYQSYMKSDHSNILFESQDPREVEAFNIEYFLNNDESEDMPTYKDNHLFDEVYEGPLMINKYILLSHEPVDMGFGINIHGHNHCGHKLDRHSRCISINVCSDVVEFEKQRLDKLVECCDYVDIHRLVIDGATNRKRIKNVSDNR